MGEIAIFFLMCICITAVCLSVVTDIFNVKPKKKDQTRSDAGMMPPPPPQMMQQPQQMVQPYTPQPDAYTMWWMQWMKDHMEGRHDNR